jgi:hypothetical protein
VMIGSLRERRALCNVIDHACAQPSRDHSAAWVAWKPDRYWSAPRAAESPVISVPKIGCLEKNRTGIGPQPRTRKGQ